MIVWISCAYHHAPRPAGALEKFAAANTASFPPGRAGFAGALDVFEKLERRASSDFARTRPGPPPIADHGASHLVFRHCSRASQQADRIPPRTVTQDLGTATSSPGGSGLHS
ncbi:hypothetical protein CMUS01_08012 [Colletotrichum musicola]|uniref:Uncharacterized protein n=1 Tax=Colletotrichum musicola TaxID=2175873 RepID=A0A8H6KE62_9PEZI|nr:hypothetical protein CMUS01_08012 [Colletotrichum musicola]